MSIKINNDIYSPAEDHQAHMFGLAADICQQTLPFMKSCDGKKWLVMRILNDNPSYCEDLVGYYYDNELDKETCKYYLEEFKQTLSHDLHGLFDKDEHFVPRINNETV